MRGRLFHLRGDWYEWRQEPALAGEVQVRVAVRVDGRLGLAELRVIGEPTSGLLRAIPVGRIEAAANAQLAAMDDNVAPLTPHLRRRTPGHSGTGNDAGWEQPDPPPKLSAQRARGRPEQFYADIAAAYGDLAQHSHRPAAELADQHGVPVTTAHRWIKEARRRGHLAPGRPGKAG